MSARLLLTAALVLMGAIAEGQVAPPVRPPRQGIAGRLGQPIRGRALGGDQPPGAGRMQLEQAVRQALARVTRRQLNLNDAQMAQLGQVDMKFDRQRRQLFQEQRQNRLALKAAMEDSAGADQAKVSQHMDRLLQLERRRVDLLEAEQKELAAFLTPLQRAQYQALQERVRLRVENAMRANMAASDSTAGVPPRPGRRGGLRGRPPLQ